jgi:hypothetical protein
VDGPDGQAYRAATEAYLDAHNRAVALIAGGLEIPVDVLLAGGPFVDLTTRPETALDTMSEFNEDCGG